MPVSLNNSGVVYRALKNCGIGLVSALPETWLVHLIRMAEDDPQMILVRLAKEEEGVGISAGAHFAGVKSAMLMQNHGFLASINGIVSCAQLYRIPLPMVISLGRFDGILQLPIPFTNGRLLTLTGKHRASLLDENIPCFALT